MPLTVLTPEDLVPLYELLRQVLAQQTAAAQPADDYLSVDQVATLTGVSTKTVRKWIAEGKPDHQGKIVRLYTLEFSPGYPRVPRSALLAFGQGQGFEAAQLVLPPAGAAPAKKTTLKRQVLHSTEALRRAS
jgi:hypothetical protein